jgi:hypothetical protein
MLFEIAGFLCGVGGIGAAFWFLHRREADRVVASIYTRPGASQRG